MEGKPHVLLICTVGGAPEPVVRSLLEEPRPESVIFICSDRSEVSITAPAGPIQRTQKTCVVCGEGAHECIDSSGILARAAAHGLSLNPEQYQIVRVTDPQDPNRCMLEIARRLSPMVSAWRSAGVSDQLIVDPTGGTKCMSAALELVARRWKCTLRYVGGGQRGKGGLGVVLDGTEKVFDCGNPLDALGYRTAEDAIVLSNQMNFGAAAQLLLLRAAAEASPREVRQRLEALGHLMALLASWDRFAHAAAASRLHAVTRWLPETSEYLDARTVAEIGDAIPEWKRRLDLLARSTRPTRELVEDLFANALRRQQEQRFDDAVARLYRGVEALAQYRLAAEHNIPNTGKVPATQVPPDLLKERLPVRGKDGSFKLGLQEDYVLLKSLGDELGVRFNDLGLAELRRSPLTARNQSILAHGFQAVSPTECAALWQAAIQLAAVIGIREESLFRFPLLRHHGF
jgi:CRISPR-associated protein (TIGR02710 family)